MTPEEQNKMRGIIREIVGNEFSSVELANIEYAMEVYAKQVRQEVLDEAIGVVPPSKTDKLNPTFQNSEMQAFDKCRTQVLTALQTLREKKI